MAKKKKKTKKPTRAANGSAAICSDLDRAAADPAAPTTTLIAIDGPSVAHRFVKPDAIRRALRLYASVRAPTLLLAAFDGQTSWRRKSLPDYKANRLPSGQNDGVIATTKRVAAELGYRIVEVADHEAEDVIFGYSVAARGSGISLIVVSDDKDLLQVVRNDVQILRPRTPDRLIGPADVLAEWKVQPGQFADLLALAGDAVDRIWGVPGIGPATAAKLISEHGSLERILLAAKKGSTPVLQKIRKHEKQVRAARVVTCLRFDQELPVPIVDLPLFDPTSAAAPVDGVTAAPPAQRLPANEAPSATAADVPASVASNTATETKREGAEAVERPYFIVRPMHESADGPCAIRVTGKTVAEAFREALKIDVSKMNDPVIEPDADVGPDDFRIVDLDVPDEAGPEASLDDDCLRRLLKRGGVPAPAFAWISHHGGVHCVFFRTEEHAAFQLAAAWAVFADLGKAAGWRIEMKAETRHPHGVGDGKCGPVHEQAQTAELFDASGDADEEWGEYLKRNGLQAGHNGREACPDACNSGSNQPVIVNAHGIKCTACGAWQPKARVLGRDDRHPTFRTSAKRLVHWLHERYILRDRRPGCTEDTLHAAWCFAVTKCGPKPPAPLPEGAMGRDRRAHAAKVKAARARLASAMHKKANSYVRLVGGIWATADLIPRQKVLNKAIETLPSVSSPQQLDAAQDVIPLEGFIEVMPVPASALRAPDAFVPAGAVVGVAPIRPGEPPPVKIGSTPPTFEEVDRAWEILDEALPGIRRHAPCVLAVLVAGLAAQQLRGQPPIVVITGSTGTGKSGIVEISGAMLGAPIATLGGGEAEEFARSIADGLLRGRCLLRWDEPMREEGRAFAKLGPVLRMGREVTFRPLYGKTTNLPMTAAIAIVGSAVPTAIGESPELSRRAVGIRLVGDKADWYGRIPGGLEGLRSVPELRGAADTITSMVWWLIKLAGDDFHWRKWLLDSGACCEVLDLADPDALEGQAESLVALYEYWRTMPDADPRVVPRGKLKGYVAIDNKNKVVSDHFEQLLDPDEGGMFGRLTNLENVDLATVFGFDTPRLGLRLKRHKSIWHLKFVVRAGYARGQEPDRTHFPQAHTAK